VAERNEKLRLKNTTK